MKHLMKITIGALIIATITIFASCEKSNVDDQVPIKKEKINVDKAGPSIVASITPYCSGLPDGQCGNLIQSGNCYNSLKIQLDSQTCGFYSTLNYKIITTSGSPTVLYDCNWSNSSCVKYISPSGGLNNSTTYKVRITNPATGGFVDYYVTTGNCATFGC